MLGLLCFPGSLFRASEQPGQARSNALGIGALVLAGRSVAGHCSSDAMPHAVASSQRVMEPRSIRLAAVGGLALVLYLNTLPAGFTFDDNFAVVSVCWCAEVPGKQSYGVSAAYQGWFL